MEYMVQLKDIHKSYGKNEILKGINMNIKKGEIVVILGPSGSGKTTLLRCINFLERADWFLLAQFLLMMLSCAALSSKETTWLKSFVASSTCLFSTANKNFFLAVAISDFIDLLIAFFVAVTKTLFFADLMFCIVF